MRGNCPNDTPIETTVASQISLVTTLPDDDGIRERPLYVNSIAVGCDRTVYSLGLIKRGGKVLTDLFAVQPRK